MKGVKRPPSFRRTGHLRSIIQYRGQKFQFEVVELAEMHFKIAGIDWWFQPNGDFDKQFELFKKALRKKRKPSFGAHLEGLLVPSAEGLPVVVGYAIYGGGMLLARAAAPFAKKTALILAKESERAIRRARHLSLIHI